MLQATFDVISSPPQFGEDEPELFFCVLRTSFLVINELSNFAKVSHLQVVTADLTRALALNTFYFELLLASGEPLVQYLHQGWRLLHFFADHMTAPCSPVC